MSTTVEKNEIPAPQHLLHRVTVTRTTTKTRELIVYGLNGSDAIESATENVDCGEGTNDFVLWDSEWFSIDTSDEVDVEDLAHELKDYAPEIAELGLDATIAEGVAAGVE